MSEAFVNLYTPPPTLLPAPTYGPTPYDINFAYPVVSSILQNDKVALTPFVPAKHAATYWAEASPFTQPALYDYLPWNFKRIEEFLSLVERIRLDPHWILFAIMDKTRDTDGDGTMAGIIGVIRCDPPNMIAEVGAILVFPSFQRTHVARNAFGLALRYCLDRPSANPPGLGLRRVVWTTSPENVASMRVAEGMGMKEEGRKRWARAWVPGKMGGRVREGEERPSVDMVEYGICWDEWEGGGRDVVTSRMENR